MFFNLLSIKEEKQGLTARLQMTGSITNNWWDDDSISGQFAFLLNSLGEVKRIEIELDSDGGSVAAGIAIANQLHRHPAHVHVRITALAASVASVLACAADTVEMDIGAMMYLHKPELSCYGNADDFAQAKETLDKHQDAIMAHYVRKAGEEKRQQIEAILNKGGYLTAQECKDLGLADIINLDATNQLPTEKLAKVMAQAAIKAQAQPPHIQPAQEHKPAAGEQFTRLEAMELPDTQALIEEERQRAADILNLCQVAHQPDLAQDLIASGASLKSAQALVAHFSASAQTLINPQNNRLSSTPQAQISAKNIYAKMNTAPKI